MMSGMVVPASFECRFELGTADIRNCECETVVRYTWYCSPCCPRSDHSLEIVTSADGDETGITSTYMEKVSTATRRHFPWSTKVHV